MNPKVFSKRHPEAGKDIYLKPAVRQRIWHLFQECDPCYDPSTGFLEDCNLCCGGLYDRLTKEHGWQELRAYKGLEEWEEVFSDGFILRGVARFVLDALEIYYDLLFIETQAVPNEYQRKVNDIFEDANLPWRMLNGRIVRLDSKWVEAEIDAKARELLSAYRFDGALHEFQEARSTLSSGDTKGAIHAANLALESTIKSILNIEREKPGVLIRKVVESGLIPDYHEGFLKAFEEHILRSVPMARNFEKGVGHGQGIDVSEPPRSLAELAVNLAGVLILYLMKRHLELTPQPDVEKKQEEQEIEDDIPF